MSESLFCEPCDTLSHEWCEHPEEDPLDPELLLCCCGEERLRKEDLPADPSPADWSSWGSLQAVWDDPLPPRLIDREEALEVLAGLMDDPELLAVWRGERSSPEQRSQRAPRRRRRSRRRS